MLQNVYDLEYFAFWYYYYHKCVKIHEGYKVELKFDTEYWFVMEIENNQCFNTDESDELTKLKLLNLALIKELRKYKEEIPN